MNQWERSIGAIRHAWAYLGPSNKRLPAYIALLVQFAQILLGIVSVPLLLRSLGTERFSALSILWALPSLIPLIDIGLPRALASLLVQPHNREPDRQSRTLLIAVGIQAGILLLLFVSVWLPFSSMLVPHGVAGLQGEIESGASTLGKFLLASAILSVANILAAFFQARGDLYKLLMINAFNGLTISAIPLSVLVVSPSLAQLGTYTLVLRGAGLCFSCALVLAVVDLRRVAACYRGARTMVAELFGGGVRSLWYFAVSPLLVFGERYIASYSDGRTQIASHLIAVDLGLRFLIVPGVIGQYSFKAIAESAGESGKFDLAVARYMPTMNNIYLLPLVGAICFARELLERWLGPAHVTGVTVACLQSVLVALTTCSVSSLLVQTTLAASAMQRLSALVIVELVCYPPLVFAAIWLRPNSMDLSLVLSLCWASRVVVEALAMTWLTRDLFQRGSLMDFSILTVCLPLLAALLSSGIDASGIAHSAVGKAVALVAAGALLRASILSRVKRRE